MCSLMTLVLLLLTEVLEQPSILSINFFRTNSKQLRRPAAGSKASYRKQEQAPQDQQLMFFSVKWEEQYWWHQLSLKSGLSFRQALGLWMLEGQCAPVIPTSSAAGAAQGADLSCWGRQQPNKACLQGFASATYHSYWQLSCFWHLPHSAALFLTSPLWRLVFFVFL